MEEYQVSSSQVLRTGRGLVEGLVTKFTNRANLKDNFMHWYAKAVLVILDEGTLLHPRYTLCKIFVTIPWV